jgi:hypothetical protein
MIKRMFDTDSPGIPAGEIEDCARPRETSAKEHQP